jgi:hypothetical protein
MMLFIGTRFSNLYSAAPLRLRQHMLRNGGEATAADSRPPNLGRTPSFLLASWLCMTQQRETSSTGMRAILSKKDWGHLSSGLCSKCKRWICAISTQESYSLFSVAVRARSVRKS